MARVWVETCNQQQQQLTWDHHQIGKAEWCILELQDIEQTMLLHSSQQWPQTINANPLPFAIGQANEAINHTLNRMQRSGLWQKFSMTVQ